MWYVTDCEGIIENVVLLGAPVTGDPKEWRPVRRVVAGTITNGFCGLVYICTV